ncbi:(d)CMP kinase [Exilibacterium tricleocarpae]|uniref:Cytidylate kinase n=1 Tax=Exilibacterium tricleocarpae TaxID=2591008 RepID=A0A545U414_9GAMM|nr:(d)CMP kinase [Exilibacterium tricleocarpae]TQV84215.1 (d)CMP kinase [Exilibacterium tricleocarpae]
MSFPVITIDGPSGSGKGTISQLVAQKLGYHFLDSGALYRVTGVAAKFHGVAMDDEPALAQIAANLDVRFETGADAGVKIILEGADVTREVRSEEGGMNASRVGALPTVRQALLARQRAFAVQPGLVADGRDMGTVVFPDAPVKVFLTASARERAQRRYKQLLEKGESVSFDDILADIEARDERDSSRAAAPLKPAQDALLLDSTGMSIDDVFNAVMRAFEDRVIP